MHILHKKFPLQILGDSSDISVAFGSDLLPVATSTGGIRVGTGTDARPQLTHNTHFL